MMPHADAGGPARGDIFVQVIYDAMRLHRQ
jgi:hypothetical protein